MLAALGQPRQPAAPAPEVCGSQQAWMFWTSQYGQLHHLPIAYFSVSALTFVFLQPS